MKLRSIWFSGLLPFGKSFCAASPKQQLTLPFEPHAACAGSSIALPSVEPLVQIVEPYHLCNPCAAWILPCALASDQIQYLRHMPGLQLRQPDCHLHLEQTPREVSNDGSWHCGLWMLDKPSMQRSSASQISAATVRPSWLPWLKPSSHTDPKLYVV